MIDGHCLGYALRQALNVRIKEERDILSAVKRVISKHNFKLAKLKDQAEHFNLEINVRCHTLDSYSNQHPRWRFSNSHLITLSKQSI